MAALAATCPASFSRDPAEDVVYSKVAAGVQARSERKQHGAMPKIPVLVGRGPQALRAPSRGCLGGRRTTGDVEPFVSSLPRLVAVGPVRHELVPHCLRGFGPGPVRRELSHGKRLR